MSSVDWRTNPLAYLIGSVATEEFLASYHEQEALHCEHQDPQRYTELLSLDRIDEIIAYSELPPQSLGMARSEPPINRSNFTFSNGNIDRGAVVRHFQQGATVIFNQLHLAEASLAHFCAALEQVFSCHVQTNVYLTPKGFQGFRTHYDDHDVFVIQISGEKQWHLYQKPIENPYRGENFKPNVHEAGDPVKTFVLKAGDCVYIPRGLMHDAESIGDEPSLHITVGLIVKTWADLMLEAMSEVALRNPKFRRSLPPGFVQEDFDRDKAEAYFKDLASSFKDQAVFSEAFDLFIDNFIRSRDSVVRGGIVAEIDEITKQSRFKRRLNVHFRFHDDEEPSITCGGGDVHFEKETGSGLKIAISGEPFGMEVFTDVDSTIALDTIKKLMAYGLVEKTQ